LKKKSVADVVSRYVLSGSVYWPLGASSTLSLYYWQYSHKM